MNNPKNKYRCIVVEDEELIRRSIVRKINELDCGFEVIGEAFDGKEAMKLIEDTLPHLVITDIRMPIMGGLELAEKIYYNYPSIKVVIISGYNEFEYAKQAIKYEVKEYLQKPITNEQLFITLTRIKMKFDSEIADIAKYFNLHIHDIQHNNIIEIIEQYLKENYMKEISLNDIASYFNFSQDYLSKLFKKHTGETPIKYIIKLRINEAKRLLLEFPNVDIKTIGELVGYDDQYYFSKIFKSQTGQTPSEFRQQFSI